MNRLWNLRKTRSCEDTELDLQVVSFLQRARICCFKRMMSVYWMFLFFQTSPELTSLWSWLPLTWRLLFFCLLVDLNFISLNLPPTPQVPLSSLLRQFGCHGLSFNSQICSFPPNFCCWPKIWNGKFCIKPVVFFVFCFFSSYFFPTLFLFSFFFCLYIFNRHTEKANVCDRIFFLLLL